MENRIIFKADSRGKADHGWLKSNHTFSFANYQNYQRMHFGVLRVLNDDIVAPDMGFGLHPHQDMEIISIPLKGSLAHKDSMGNSSEIKTGDIQVMSAGTGVQHSEFNPSKTSDVHFLQIWLFPDTLNVTPRYDQVTLNQDNRHNKWDTIISPKSYGQGTYIHQNAWFSLADLDQDISLEYQNKDKHNGIFLMVLNGEVKIGDQTLQTRDAIGITNEDKIEILAQQNSELLLMEIPMELPSYLGQ